MLEKIELISQSECLAHIIIKGSDDALKIHNVPKPNYKYKGSYKINYNESYIILVQNNRAVIDFVFEEKEYLPSSHINFNLSPKFLLPKNDNYRSTIESMLDDLTEGLNIIKIKSHNDFQNSFKKYEEYNLGDAKDFYSLIENSDNFDDLMTIIRIKKMNDDNLRKKLKDGNFIKKKKKKWW